MKETAAFSMSGVVQGIVWAPLEVPICKTGRKPHCASGLLLGTQLYPGTKPAMGMFICSLPQCTQRLMKLWTVRAARQLLRELGSCLCPRGLSLLLSLRQLRRISEP